MTGPGPAAKAPDQESQVPGSRVPGSQVPGSQATVPVWDELVAAALLGTERRPFEVPAAPGPLGRLVAGPSLSLADAAAATWAYIEAGRRPPAAGGPSRVPAPPDDRPALPRGAVRALSAILRDPRLRVLLEEWLELAAGDGRRLPGRLLPDLLDAVHGAGPAAAAAVESVAGPRASWLVAQNPAWQRPDAVPPGSTDRLLAHLRDPGRSGTGPGPVWSGSDQARTSLFASVRAADPEVGRRLAGLVWADEPGTTRAAIVAGLASGLSMADEPWLEERLDDRRRDVRDAAADLLRRLPDSRLAGRMAARARPLVTRSGHPPVLVVTPPPEPDRDARRDGVGPPGDHEEAVAARLEALIGATPLTAWDEVAAEGSGPDLVEWAVRDGDAPDAPLDSPLAGALRAGWSRAAVLQQDRRWAHRLLEAGAVPEPGLLALVDGGTGDRAVTGWLARTGLPTAVGLLLRLPRPWSGAVTASALDAVAALMQASGNPAAPSPAAAATSVGAGQAAEVVRDALAPMAALMDPSRPELAARLSAALDALPDGVRPGARLYWARSLDRLITLVNFRHYMRQEFR